MYKEKNHQSGSPSSRISTDVNVLAYIISAFSPFFLFTLLTFIFQVLPKKKVLGE